MIDKKVKECPSTKVVVSGYSQGGQVVHNAAKLLPASTMAKVSSVVIFGDPGKLPLSPVFDLNKRLTATRLRSSSARRFSSQDSHYLRAA